MKIMKGHFSSKKYTDRQKHNFVFDIVLGIGSMLLFLGLEGYRLEVGYDQSLV